MWKFIKYEIKYWLGSPMVWIFLLINTLLIFGAVSSDSISVGGGVGNVYKNSPYVVQNYYGVMSLICLLMTTAFMNATANRDFQYGMYQFVFSSPVKKRDYFFGKFIGAAIIAVIPLIGVSVGSLLGPLMPWTDAERYGNVVWSGHLWGLLGFGIPNVVISGVLLYGLSVIFRSNIVSFVGAMVMLVFYIVSAGFIEDIDKEWLANALDPFGFRPLELASKYMTVAEKNQFPTPITGAFLWNRLLWLGIALVGLILLYTRFSFTLKNEKSKREKAEEPEMNLSNAAGATPAIHQQFGFSAAGFMAMVRLELKSIIKNPTFIILVIIGLINLIAGLTSFTGSYGSKQFPVTYNVMDTIRGSFYLFLVGIITFYSGVVVWKERDAKFNEIQDSTPMQSAAIFFSKFLALTISVGIILLITALTGMIAQLMFGYSQLKPDVYLKGLLLIDYLGFIYLIVFALVFHYLINNRYIAYFAFVAFVILNEYIWGVFEVSSNMLKYAGTPRIVYSDMNGFGPFVESTLWFNAYWILISMMLLLITAAFYIRGTELKMKKRWQNFKSEFADRRIAFGAVFAVWLLCAAFVYYNTQILNHYQSEDEAEQVQVDYELAYKKYEGIPQPRYCSFDYKIDIFPEERNLLVEALAMIKNSSDVPIDEIHFTMPLLDDSLKIDVPDAQIKLQDNRLGYRIYKLSKPMMPGDSMEIKFSAVNLSKGFENEVSFTQITENGTFFNNRDIIPSIGYEEGNELADKHKRRKKNLPPRIRLPRLDENNLPARMNTYIANDADWVNIHTIISTASNQTAVAPGSLLKKWEEGGRAYFEYQLDKASLNFYSFISARYEVERKEWNGILMEVYYDAQHAYNVPNMMRSIEKSLEYYTQNFGPYFHQQCRIIEFPRYESFAQAFPGTMPYSEAIGFITDLRDVKDDDIDDVFYVVAHEMGHQYWAHQICGAKMQGSEMMSEGFAQYSALMVMEKEYGREKMKKFMEYEMDNYLNGRSSEFEAERPLMYTENQGYIHYNKASVVMYCLKEMIGEAQVNAALKSLIDTFAYKKPPYPVSTFAVKAFRKVTPDSLQYLIDDMFENITLYSNRISEATCTKSGENYLVTLKTKSEKFRADSLGNESPVVLNDYIDVAIFGEGGDEKGNGKELFFKRVKVTAADNEFKFEVKQKPLKAGIDPYNILVDRIPDDNVMKVSEK